MCIYTVCVYLYRERYRYCILLNYTQSRVITWATSMLLFLLIFLIQEESLLFPELVVWSGCCCVMQANHVQGKMSKRSEVWWLHRETQGGQQSAAFAWMMKPDKQSLETRPTARRKNNVKSTLQLWNYSYYVLLLCCLAVNHSGNFWGVNVRGSCRSPERHTKHSLFPVSPPLAITRDRPAAMSHSLGHSATVISIQCPLCCCLWG